MSTNPVVTLTNFNAENFIRVFVDVYFDHQMKVVEIFKEEDGHEEECGEVSGGAAS